MSRFATKRAVARASAGWLCLVAVFVFTVWVPLAHALKHDPHDHVHTATGTVALDTGDGSEQASGDSGERHFDHLVTIRVRPMSELVTDGYARLAAGEPLAAIVGEAHTHGHTDSAHAEHAHGEHAHGNGEHTPDRPAVGVGAPSADDLGHADGPAHFQAALVRVAAALIVLRAHPAVGPAPAPIWRASVHHPAPRAGPYAPRGPPVQTTSV